MSVYARKKRSELRDFDVYGQYGAEDWVYIGRDVAKRISSDANVHWVSENDLGTQRDFKELESRNPAHYVAIIAPRISNPAIRMTGVFRASEDDYRDVVISPTSRTKDLVDKLRSMSENPESIDRAFREWVFRKGDPLEERRVKEMLGRRRETEAKLPVNCSTSRDRDGEASRRTLKAFVSTAIVVDVDKAKQGLAGIRRMGIPEAERKALLEEVSKAEASVRAIREEIEGIRGGI